MYVLCFTYCEVYVKAGRSTCRLEFFPKIYLKFLSFKVIWVQDVDWRKWEGQASERRFTFMTWSFNANFIQKLIDLKQDSPQFLSIPN